MIYIEAWEFLWDDPTAKTFLITAGMLVYCWCLWAMVRPTDRRRKK